MCRQRTFPFTYHQMNPELTVLQLSVKRWQNIRLELPLSPTRRSRQVLPPPEPHREQSTKSTNIHDLQSIRLPKRNPTLAELCYISSHHSLPIREVTTTKACKLNGSPRAAVTSPSLVQRIS
jgi:hypothetical protein